MRNQPLGNEGNCQGHTGNAKVRIANHHTDLSYADPGKQVQRYFNILNKRKQTLEKWLYSQKERESIKCTWKVLSQKARFSKNVKRKCQKETGASLKLPSLTHLGYFEHHEWILMDYNNELKKKTIHRCLLILTVFQLSSVIQSYLTLCDPMDYSSPSLSVHHHLPELTQTHVHWVSDAIQPFHPLSSPSPPAFSLSKHQGHFQWVSFSHQVAKVLEFQLQHQSFQWLFRTDFLYDWLVGSPCSPKGLSRVFFNTTVQEHQFFGAQLSL